MAFSLPRLLGLVNRKGASLEAALGTILGRKKFEDLSASCPDKRELLEKAALQLGVSEESLLERVARRLSHPCVRRVPPADLDLLGGKLLLSDMRRSGCIAVTSAGEITGLVCVDPALARSVISYLINQREGGEKLIVYLARWDEIIRALDESERIHIEQKQKRETLEMASEMRTAEKVILHIVKEAQDFGQCQLEVVFLPDEMVYEIQTSSLSKARGSINNRLRRGLFAALSAGQSGGGIVLEVPGQASGLTCHVLMIEERKTARITWSTSDHGEVPAKPTREGLTLEASTVRRQAPELGGFQHTVLIIDDNSTFIRVLDRFMQRQEIRTRSASDGAEALNILSKHNVSPDLVICDVHMPGMNGIEFVKAFRKEQRYSEIPLVMLTSDDDVEVELKLIGDGADAFIAKNEDPRILCAHVKRLLEKCRGKKAA